MKLGASGGSLFGAKISDSMAVDCCGACTTSRGVTSRQGVDKGEVAPGLWMPSQTGDPGLQGPISSSRKPSRGFDELHAREPPLTSNAGDCSRDTQFGRLPLWECVIAAPPMLGRGKRSAHRAPKGQNTDELNGLASASTSRAGLLDGPACQRPRRWAEMMLRHARSSSRRRSACHWRCSESSWPSGCCDTNKIRIINPVHDRSPGMDWYEIQGSSRPCHCMADPPQRLHRHHAGYRAGDPSITQTWRPGMAVRAVFAVLVTGPMRESVCEPPLGPSNGRLSPLQPGAIRMLDPIGRCHERSMRRPMRLLPNPISKKEAWPIHWTACGCQGWSGSRPGKVVARART